MIFLDFFFFLTHIFVQRPSSLSLESTVLQKTQSPPKGKPGLSNLFGMFSKERTLSAESKTAAGNATKSSPTQKNIEQSTSETVNNDADTENIRSVRRKAVKSIPKDAAASLKLYSLSAIEDQIAEDQQLTARSEEKNYNHSPVEEVEPQETQNHKSTKSRNIGGLFEEIGLDQSDMFSPPQFNDNFLSEQTSENFGRISARRRPNLNYQNSTKLGKYISSKKQQQETADSFPYYSQNNTSVKGTKLLSKDKEKSSTSTVAAISLLPTQHHSNAKGGVVQQQNLPNFIEPLDQPKQRKRASVIFSPTFMNSLNQQQTSSSSLDVEQHLVESLKADIFSSDGRHPKFEVLKEPIREEDEDEEESGIIENQNPEDEEEEEGMIVSSSKPFSEMFTGENEEEEEFPLDEDDEGQISQDGEEDLRSVPSAPEDEEEPDQEQFHRQPPPPPPPAMKKTVAPPPPPPPKQIVVKAAVGDDVLASIRTGAKSLKRVEPEERVVDMRSKLLQSIKSGGANLKTTAKVVTQAKINTAMVRVSF
jgi:hypothetical protein